MSETCTYCGKQCKTIIIDEGYGTTEAWGIPSTHHYYVAVSDCCYEDVVDKYGVILSASDAVGQIEKQKTEIAIDAII